MSAGITIHEADEKKPSGFFPKLYESVCHNMGNERAGELEKYRDDTAGMLRWDSLNLIV